MSFKSLGVAALGVGETRLLDVRSSWECCHKDITREKNAMKEFCCKERLELLNGRTRRFWEKL